MKGNTWLNTTWVRVLSSALRDWACIGLGPCHEPAVVVSNMAERSLPHESRLVCPQIVPLACVLDTLC